MSGRHLKRDCSCPTKDKADDEGDDLDAMLAANGLHKGVMCVCVLQNRSIFASSFYRSKKFHEKRSDVSRGNTRARARRSPLVDRRSPLLQFEAPRRKRSAGFGGSPQPNPYLSGEPLHSVSKKDGRHIY